MTHIPCVIPYGEIECVSPLSFAIVYLLSTPEIAVVGAGLIGRSHISVLQALDTAAMCAIVDPTEDARLLALECAVPWYQSLSALFAAQQPAGVVIATPNHLHVEQAIFCISQGVPGVAGETGCRHSGRG